MFKLQVWSGGGGYLRSMALVHACRFLGLVVVEPYDERSIVFNKQEPPYHDDRITSRQVCEIMQRRARLALRWGTTWEVLVLFVFVFHVFLQFRQYLPNTSLRQNVIALRISNY